MVAIKIYTINRGTGDDKLAMVKGLEEYSQWLERAIKRGYKVDYGANNGHNRAFIYATNEDEKNNFVAIMEEE